MRDDTSLRVLQHSGAGGLRSQLAEADRSGARWAAIIGDDEAANSVVSLKWLREADEPFQRSADNGGSRQTTMAVDELIATLTAAP